MIKFLRHRLRNPEVRDEIYRSISIALIAFAITACVVLVMAFIMKLQVLMVAFTGVLSVTVAFYLFINLWPQKASPETNASAAVLKAMEKRKPKPLSPEEYRRQRERAQQMIRDKAAPALAKAIRGYLQQDEMEQKAAWREKRRK